jgi:hypothetical protein
VFRTRVAIGATAAATIEVDGLTSTIESRQPGVSPVIAFAASPCWRTPMRPVVPAIALCVVTAACAYDPDKPDSQPPQDDTAPPSTGPDPFADEVVSFEPGEFAGYGQDALPDVVLGGPEGAGASAGSADVVSLGQGGVIVLAFTDIGLVDGEGPDLLVFENAFTAWPETGVVAVSEDGETWLEWPCDAADAEGGYPGCAGVTAVLASSANGIDATDPDLAGGDAFDLADLGLSRARYVRITDSGANSYSGDSGGFDLDALAVVNGEPL